MRLVASPRAETPTSKRLPSREKAGRLAVTMTAATFLVWRSALDVAGVDAEPLEHADQGFAGEERVVELVAGAVEADHEAVADELVVADALDVGDVLDPHLREGEAREDEDEGEKEQAVVHRPSPG